jgi:hypothetical protein
MGVVCAWWCGVWVSGDGVSYRIDLYFWKLVL